MSGGVRFRCVLWGEVHVYQVGRGSGVCGGVRFRCVWWGEVQVCVVG